MSYLLSGVCMWPAWHPVFYLYDLIPPSRMASSSPFYKWGQGGSEWASRLPNVTQQIGGRAGSGLFCLPSRALGFHAVLSWPLPSTADTLGPLSGPDPELPHLARHGEGRKILFGITSMCSGPGAFSLLAIPRPSEVREEDLKRTLLKSRKSLKSDKR